MHLRLPSKPTVIRILKLCGKILTGLLFAVTILAAYGGYFNPENWTLPSILLLFFPYLAMLTLTVSAIWFVIRRWIWGSIGIAILLACGPTFLDALPFRFGNRPSNPDHVFRMVTFNCLHMLDSRNPEASSNRSLHFLIHSGADFVCLQELYALGKPEIPERYQAQIDSLKAVYPYYSQDGGKEVEFLSKYPFEYMQINLSDDLNYGNAAAYRLKINGFPLTVINVHLPSYLLSTDERNIITEANNQKGVEKSFREFEGSIYKKMKNAFIERARVSKAIAEYAAGIGGNVIVCGDFNDVPGSWSYRNFTTRGFHDAYAQTGFGHLITYNEHMMYFHIDQILYRGDMVPLWVKKERMDASDHYPLVAEFEFI